MAEIKVTVSSTKPQKVSVSNNTIQHEVTASPDLAQYYSNISKNYSETAENWATKTDGTVDGIEYSAKHYAQKAETLGIEALQNLEIAETQAIADVNVARDNAIIELNTTGQEQINTVSEKVSEAIEGVENAGRIVEEAIEDIQNTAEKNKKELQTISNEIKENAQDIANRTSLSMFDTILKDHLLTYEESKGLALQGTYVYKEAIAGSRYGYPDFYAKCLEEFQDSSNTKQWFKTNATKIGSLVDNQGVLSGFSNENYAIAGQSFNTSTNSWEINFKITTGNSVTGSQIIYESNRGFGTGSLYSPIRLYVSEGFWSICISNVLTNETRKIGTTEIKSNTTYYTKLIFDGTAYKLYISTNGTAYTEEISFVSSTPVYQGLNFLIGRHSNTTGPNVFLGSIDLNECYININGERWWVGTATLVKNTNGHTFYDITQKKEIDEVFTSTGIAWFYGIDTENERVFLPRNHWFEQLTGYAPEVNKAVEAGLPNITGTTTSLGAGGEANGAFSVVKSWGNGLRTGDGGSHETCYRKDFNASRSSSVYGKSNTVQPNAVRKLLYICVGNTVSDTSWVDVVTQVEGGVKDLEDKTLEGIERLKQSSTALTQAQITNCITEIPQRIKYTLENGTLTIKAGSVVIVPYGIEDLTSQYPVGSTFLNDNFVVVDTQFEDSKFFVWAEIQNDIVVIVPTSTRTSALVDVTIVGNTAFPAVGCASGETAPTAGRYYNTRNNKYYDMSNTNGTLSLPILSCNFVVNTGFTSVNQVFNGFGYIGSTIWVDKGVKVLMPNGKNADGSLNNIEFTTSSISTRNETATNNYKIFLSPNGIGNTSVYVYDEYRNLNYNSSNNAIAQVAIFGSFRRTSGVVSDFKPPQALRMLDSNTPHIVKTYQNSNSWYKIWSDGWCEQGGIVKGSDAEFTFTFLKPFKTLPTINVHVYGYYKQDLLQQAASYHFMVPRAVSLTGFKTWASSYGTCWEAKGYIA